MNSGARVSIPNSVRKTIQNIKEITGNHSEDEIYAMLRECSMDPNETAQKLLSQDPFHEVRRKRDRKKENPIKESTEPRWKHGMQGRGNRGGRGPYPSRHNSHEGGIKRNVVTGKENEINKGANETVITPATHEKKNKEKSIVASSSNISPESPVPEKTSSVPDGHLSASDPILSPSQESRIPVSTIKREWKPKPTNPIPIPIPVQVEIQVQSPETPDSIPVPVIPVEPSITPESTIPESKPESQIPDTKHVIIPNHLHVPEAEKLGFRFGSFDFNSVSLNEPVSDTCPLSEQPSDEITEHIIEVQQEQEVVVITTNDEDDNTVDDVASSVVHEPKQESSPPRQQYPAVTFGFMPPVSGTHIAPSENSESQPRVPSLVVQQSFDPTNYYPQFYRENDGRVSPFQPQGGPLKFNGNVISSQEVGNSIMSTPLSTQATGSTMTAQQPVPVFRQPPGIHLPHYPLNYIPYGPYFSPFYIPNPGMHQFLSNGGFPQQGQTGNMYPGALMPAGKYPGQQYKAGGNIGNAGHVGGYGYNVNPGGGNNSGSNEDLGGPQFKDNNVYVTGQQSESPGVGVWIATPGRDIPGSFYNLPQGGQVAYTPPQPPSHPSFTNIYHHPPPPVTTASLHPLQSMAGGVDMVGPTSTMYQPPPQINWPNNY